MSNDANQRTQSINLGGVHPYRIVTPREVFARIYSRLRPILLSADRPCYVLASVIPPEFAFDHLVLPLVQGRSADVIVGRHGRCDLRLREDRTASLRHLLVRAYLASESAARIKLLDLHSQIKFHDESGRQCSGIVSDGHLFVTVGRYHLLAVLNDGIEWPADADEAWSRLGERSILDSVDSDEQVERALKFRPRLRLLDSDASRTGTTVTRIRGPSHVQDLPDYDGDMPIASLVFPIENGDLCVRLSGEVLSEGVLVGRYNRCQLRTTSVLQSDRISRVHLCLILDETGLWGIDTASLNGTTCDGKPFRSKRLDGNAELSLAKVLLARLLLA